MHIRQSFVALLLAVILTGVLAPSVQAQQFVQLLNGNTPVASGNPLPVTVSGGGGGGNVNIQQGGVNLSATNGIYTNVLQGNAVLSLTNPSFCSLTDGTTKVSVTAGHALQVDASATTQPVSAASLPLPTGAATAAKQPALGTAGSASADVITVQGVASMTPVAVSAASLPLPSGASTAAKQPALGTAGTASADVITVQGIASMTALKVDGSGVTQPVSGTFWQATQPVSGTVTANAGTGNLGVNVTQVLGAALSATNGLYSNLLQGNAVLSVSNPIFSEPTDGTAALTTGGHYMSTRLSADGTNFNDSTHPVYTMQIGTTAANQTTTNGSIPATDTTITLTAAATHIIIDTSSGAATLYVNMNGTATTSNFPIFGGGSFTYVGPAISSLHIIGASASGTYGVFAY